MKKTEQYYDKTHIKFLEKLWGDGYLSPGGSKEVSRLLKNIDLSNKAVLDIGCGSGGITTSLITDYKAKKVIGIDIEEDVCCAAKNRVSSLGLEKKITILKVEPGVFKFKDLSFDVVFSKDSIVHVADKQSLFKEVFRVLKVGGNFVCSDWLRSDDDHRKGEFVLVITGCGDSAITEKRAHDAMKIMHHLEGKLSLRDAVRVASEISGTKKNVLYDKVVGVKD